MRTENLELSTNMSEAIEKLEFGTSQERNREYVKELKTIRKKVGYGFRE